VGEFTRDPNDWLRRYSPDEWIRAALAEVARAEAAWERGDARAGAAGVKRAAGMALNAALIVEPEPSWGRTYLEHVHALAEDSRVPQAVRDACRAVLEAKGPSGGGGGGSVVTLRTPRAHVPVIEAAKDVVAHAFAVVRRHDP
jgi:HEPN domain-containing protein